MGKKIFSLILFLISATSFSQLTVTTNSLANALAQTIAGNGVTVSNATINCDPLGAGTFSYSGSNLGLTNGIILTTGYASDASNPGSTFVSESPVNSFNDPDLTTIASGSLNDVCLIAFDFVPICNSLSLTFVFGSEEYPAFVNSSFNDAFGIFLTGPNPGGGTYTSKNIGVLPNNTAVSINNVNAGTNSAYFHNNYTTPNNDVVYDGYTIPVTSVTSVVPCSTYHIKFAIADVGDESYDSGVFIQGNSLNCTNTPTVTPTATGATCGTLGSASVTVTNYTGTPTYQWLPGGATTASINNLTPGTYTCLVGLQTGCGINTNTVTAIVTSSGASFSYTPTSVNPSCNNGTNGSVGVAVSGGTAPYTYTWTTSPVQNTATAPNLPAGTYVVNVTDNTGCIGSTTITLTNPAVMVATVTTTPTTCTASIGTAGANVVSGGVSPYTYMWNTSPVQPIQTAMGLAQGVYSVVITDANTCTATATGTVSTQGLTWSVTVSNTNPKCTASTDGTATVTVTNPGISGPFGCLWSPTAQTGTVVTGLSSGTYTALITDNNGCVSTITTTLINPPPLTATVNTSPTICSGATGSATVTVLSGGTAPFNYTWITNPVQTSNIAVNLAQATYTVLIKDVNNCSLIDTGTVYSTGFTWSPIASSSPTKCFGSSNGTATVNITNPGSSNFSYVWMPSAQTNSVATNLPIGNYTVTVKDVTNGCVSTASTSITQPTQIVTSTQSTPAMCTASNGTAYAITYGGLGPYTYSWSITNPVQTTQTATGLAQGLYTVIVSDINSCSVAATAIIGDTTDLKVTASQSPDICSSGIGKATANPKGQSPYSYVWSTTPADTLKTADSLVVGTYSVQVTDANGCVASASTSVINVDDILSTQFLVTPEGIVYAEDAIVLNISANGGWNLDSANLSGGVKITGSTFPYMFPKYGDYAATYYYTSIHGCRDSVTESIIVKDYITLYIPNTFTPNGDGANDVFAAAGTFVNTFEMDIYDRWGVLVTKLDNITKFWDGTKNGGSAPEDTYVYKGSASDVFGKRVSFHGQVNLIR